MQDCHSVVAADIGLLGCDACDAESLGKWLLTCRRIVVHSSLWCNGPRIAWPWGRRHHKPLKHQKPLTLCHSVTLWHRHVSHPSRVESSAAPPWEPHISRFAWCDVSVGLFAHVVWVSVLRSAYAVHVAWAAS